MNEQLYNDAYDRYGFGLSHNLFNQEYPLNGYDIMSICGMEIGFTLESEFEIGKMHNDALAVLVNDQEDVHHWACLVRNWNSYCYFDSFGEKPKNKNLLAIIDRYMNKELQSESAVTCGRWVGHFLRYFGINEDAYSALFKGCKERDRYITLVTGQLASFTLRDMLAKGEVDRVSRLWKDDDGS